MTERPDSAKLDLLPPTSGEPPVDRRTEFEERGKKNLRHKKAKGAFAARPTDRRLRGTAGFGIYYRPAFMNDWSMATSLQWDCLCPEFVGGNVTRDLYITAMNRAAKGAEALIWYNGQSQVEFWIFDWAQALPWQGCLTFAQLADYRFQSDQPHPGYEVIRILNTTAQTGPDQWTNQVCLLNIGLNQWEQMYSYVYGATLAEQQSGAQGYWGPTVETFEANYHGTQPLGALGTQLCRRDGVGPWSPWQQLGPADSYVEDAHVGFGPIFLDANYAWAVQS